MRTHRWLPVQDVLDELEDAETERLYRSFRERGDEPDPESEPAPGWRPAEEPPRTPDAA